jgi:hypothetical protein
VSAVLGGADAFYFSRRDRIVALAAQLALSASYHLRELPFGAD